MLAVNAFIKIRRSWQYFDIQTFLPAMSGPGGLRTGFFCLCAITVEDSLNMDAQLLVAIISKRQHVVGKRNRTLK